MWRRHVLSMGAGAALGPWTQQRAAAQARPPKRMGVLPVAPPSWFRAQPFWKDIVEGLRRQGWEEGRNVVFVFPPESVHAQGIDEAARYLVGDKVDMIYSMHEFTALPALRATRTIPIVTWTSAVVELGLGKTLARPGGNVTGVMTQSYEEHGKVLALLREMRPGLSRIGFSVGRDVHVWNVWYESFVAAAEPTGIEVVPLRGHYSAADVPLILADGTREQVQVLITGPAWWLNQNKEVWDQIHAWAIQQRVITKGSIVQRGQVMLSFGVALGVLQDMVDQLVRVLRGANPAELPYVQATQFDLVINQRLALAAGWPAPRNLLLQATEVIE